MRNDRVVRQSSFQGNLIEWHDHLSWVKRKINDNNALIFIAEHHGEKIGQIRFECLEGDSSAEVHIAIAEKYRGQGHAKNILLEGCKTLFLKKSVLLRVIAHVKESNIASVNSFVNAGFIRMQDLILYNTPCISLVLYR